MLLISWVSQSKSLYQSCEKLLCSRGHCAHFTPAFGLLHHRLGELAAGLGLTTAEIICARLKALTTGDGEHPLQRLGAHLDSFKYLLLLQISLM